MSFPPIPRAFTSKPVLACTLLLLLIGLTYVIPGAERFQLFSPKPTSEQIAPAASDFASAPEGSIQLVEETHDRPELAIPLSSKSTRSVPDVAPTDPPPISILDPSGKALDPFFSALLAVEKKEKGAIARVLHYGDSLLSIDFVTGTLRRKLQSRFNDAGHGYMPIANPWPGYFHNDVIRLASSDWSVSRIVGPFAPDGLYGLGGVSFLGFNKAAWARYATTKKGDHGRAVSRFGVQYLEQPSGGTLQVQIDEDRVETIETTGEIPKLRQRVFEVPDGPHQFEVKVKKGPVRAFGTWMERSEPGVVLDSIGIQGARLRFLGQSNQEHFAQALQMRAPNLLVFQFGLNESVDGLAYPMDRYRETALSVLASMRKALPNTGCLVIAPNDVGRKQGTSIVSANIMSALVKAQEDVALQAGCAFFDTRKAMGGEGSIATWVQRGLAQPDLTHPTLVGAELISTWIFQAIMEAYEPFRRRHGGDGVVGNSVNADDEPE